MGAVFPAMSGGKGRKETRLEAGARDERRARAKGETYPARSRGKGRKEGEGEMREAFPAISGGKGRKEGEGEDERAGRLGDGLDAHEALDAE